MATTINAGRVRFVSRGTYNNSTQYYLFDLVDYNGSSYIAKENSLGNLPTNTQYWQLIAEKGNTGSTGQTGPVGATGNGIQSITKTATSGLVDTYTITYTNGNTTTFTVTNGEDANTTDISKIKEEITALQTENSRLKGITNALPKISGEDTSLTLTNTANAPFSKLILKGNTSQNGEPTPSSPKAIHTISGNNEIKINNKNLVFSQLDSKNIDYKGQIVNQNGFNLNIARVVLGQTYTTSKVSDTSIWDLIFAFYESEPSLGSQSYNSSRVVQSNNSTFTAPITGYVAFRSNSSISNIQLEKGLTSTTYVRHKEQAYPINLGDIELCKIGDYQDYFYKSGSKWYLHKEKEKIIVDGSSDEDWSIRSDKYFQCTKSNEIGIFHYSWISQTFGPNSLQYAKSNIGVIDYRILDWGTGFGLALAYGVRINLENIDASNGGTIEQLRAYLAENPITIYVAQNSTDTEITDTTLISQLNALYNAYTYNDTTNITQTNANLPFYINAEAFKKIS